MDKAHNTKLLKQWNKKLLRLSEKVGKDFSFSAIHDFRIEYKRVKALLSLLSPPASSGQTISFKRFMRKAFQIAGRIRDIQVHLDRLQKDLPDKQEWPSTYAGQFNKELKRLRKKWKRLMSSVEKRTRSFSGAAYPADKVTLAVFKNWIRVKKLEIRKISGAANFSDKNIHTLRKLFKEITYNIQHWKTDLSGDQEINGVKQFTRPGMGHLLIQLGDYHDLCVSVLFVQSAYIRNLPSDELDKIKWLKKKWLMEKRVNKALIIKIIKIR